jgi:hypothetical protein
VLLESAGVVDDVAAARERAARFALPAGALAEGEVGVPDDVTGSAEAADRVVSLWDGSRLAGRWFAGHSVGGLSAPGEIAWDAYLAFGKRSRWRGQPTCVLAAGSDIIDNTSGLEQHFIPLLPRG